MSWGGRKVMGIRARWTSEVQAGRVQCHLCGAMIEPGTPWDLDHLDALMDGGAEDGAVHPAHATCNRRRGAAMMHDRRRILRGAETPRGVYLPFPPPKQNLAQTVGNAPDFAAWVQKWRKGDRA